MFTNCERAEISQLKDVPSIEIVYARQPFLSCGALTLIFLSGIEILFLLVFTLPLQLLFY